MTDVIVNIVVAGLGGQGVLSASDVLAEALRRAGYSVEKSEINGSSHSEGPVTRQIRYGSKVPSPVIPSGQADFLVALEAAQVEPHQHWLRPDGILISPEALKGASLPNHNGLGVALLGTLSAHLPVPQSDWLDALRTGSDLELFGAHKAAFLIGRERRLREFLSRRPAREHPRA